MWHRLCKFFLEPQRCQKKRHFYDAHYTLICEDYDGIGNYFNDVTYCCGIGRY